MTTTEPARYTAEQIEAIGGSRWTSRTGELRVYLNDWHPLIDLDIDRYGTGNVRSASLRGESLSNRRASSLATAKVYWRDGKIWTDLAALADRIGVGVGGSELVETLKSEIARLVSQEG
jgi:hypothetical protein